jgi:hypothetical protein
VAAFCRFEDRVYLESYGLVALFNLFRFYSR